MVAESAHRFAATEGIVTLYKFRRFGSEQERAWVREILVEHKVYFSRSSELNDRHDLKPHVRFQRGDSDSDTRHLLLEDAEAVWARQQPPPTPEQLESYKLRLSTQPLKVLERDAVLRTHERLEENYWIFSLATSRDWIHMWKDYADEARGLCIHFRADAHSPFGFAQRVIYQAERPELLVPFGDLSERDIADRATLIKTRRWAREEEYRLIRYPGVDYSEAGLRFDGQYGHFRPDAICGITVGLEMADSDVALILDLASRHQPPLRVERPQRP